LKMLWAMETQLQSLAVLPENESCSTETEPVVYVQ
jgi:hypothetical protein